MSGSGSLDPSDPAAAAQPPARQHVVILSGLSGAGKTAATKLFEDLGYICVDNLPGELLPELAELVRVLPGLAGDAAMTARRIAAERGSSGPGPRAPAAGLLPRGA